MERFLLSWVSELFVLSNSVKERFSSELRANVETNSSSAGLNTWSLSSPTSVAKLKVKITQRAIAELKIENARRLRRAAPTLSGLLSELASSVPPARTDALLSPQDIATHLGVSLDVVYGWIKTGTKGNRLVAINNAMGTKNARYKVAPSELERFLKKVGLGVETAQPLHRQPHKKS